MGFSLSEKMKDVIEKSRSVTSHKFKFVKLWDRSTYLERTI